MKFLWLFAIIFLYSCIFVSCSNSSTYTLQIKQLDSTLVVVDSAMQKIATIDTAKIVLALNEITSDLKACQEQINDTLPFETATLLSKYQSSVKPFKTILQKQKDVAEALSISKKQLQNLIHDFKIDKMDKNNASIYIQDELSIATQAINSVNMITNLIKLHCENFELNKPKIDAFIATLKN